MDIIILSGLRPNCAICNKPLKSWNPLIENEECVPCIADKVSTALINEIKRQFTITLTPECYNK